MTQRILAVVFSDPSEVTMYIIYQEGLQQRAAKWGSVVILSDETAKFELHTIRSILRLGIGKRSTNWWLPGNKMSSYSRNRPARTSGESLRGIGILPERRCLHKRPQQTSFSHRTLYFTKGARTGFVDHRPHRNSEIFFCFQSEMVCRPVESIAICRLPVISMPPDSGSCRSGSLSK